jgi:hypothetical protein
VTVTAGSKLRVSQTATWENPVRVGCRARRAANQSINASSTTALSWDTEDQDTDGFIAVTSTTVTIPTGLGGEYGVSVFVVGATTGARNFIELVPTSTITGMPTSFRQSFTNNEARGAATFVLPLLAGDTFLWNIFQGSAGAINFTGWMNCVLLSP